MDCISCTRSGSYQLVGITTFRDQAIGRFPRRSVRSLPASLATTLDVPVVRRLCRPMIGSCHEAFGPPTKNVRKVPGNNAHLWITPVRSEALRVGRECVSRCRSRGYPYNENKNKANKT